MKMLQRMKRILRPAAKDDTFYKGEDYLANYVAHTQHRVAKDPQEAVGGMWDEIGTLQFQFLTGQGLAPGHRMLDIGCGTLRGGRHFIRHLDGGGYTGIDIAPACIEAGQQLVKDEGLADKSPRLVLNESRKMDFAQFQGETFDYLLAQSVFTHLPADLIDECFAHISRVMTSESAFYCTYFSAEHFEQTNNKGFAFPFEFLRETGQRHGFEVDELSHDYPHPRSQKMARARKAR